MPEQAAVFRNEVLSSPSLVRLGCDVEMHLISRILFVAGPIPHLVDDAALAGRAVESRLLHCRFFLDERVVVADAGDEEAVRLQFRRDGRNRQTKLSCTQMRQGIIHGDDCIEVGFDDLVERCHIGDVELDCQIAMVGFALCAVDGGGAQVGRHDLMAQHGEPDCLGADSACAIENFE